MFRSLELSVVVRQGRIESVVLGAGQEENGWVGAGLNPIRVQLQPIFFKGLGEYQGARKPEDISLIVIHQTAGGGSVHGSLSEFIRINPATGKPVGSPHYIVSAEAKPQVVKISRDNHPAGHAGGNLTSWDGKANVDMFSIGIENSHKTGTPWPRPQIDRLIRLLEQLLRAYPSISRQRIVGHSDVLWERDRECPGLDFDWVLLEKQGLGIVPRSGAVSLDLAYGGFFRLEPQGHLQQGNNDGKRLWGEVKDRKKGPQPWAASPAAAAVIGSLAGGMASLAGQNRGASVRNLTEGAVATLAQGQITTTVLGAPIRELQIDLRDMGYAVAVDGDYGPGTTLAVGRFQKHFFSGSRRGLIPEATRGKVDRVTAEYIKRVRP
jgi:N-acetyl-anhydromuramyl-L-alanine amidase AmpD